MAAGDSVLKKLLERLMAGLLNGPGLNCRPHNSRQRIDLTALGRLDDLEPAKILAELLGSSRKVRIAARVPQPRNLDPVEAANPPPDDAYGNGHDNNAAQDQVERALKPWRDQQSVLSKLRTITEDARTYEQDTGVNVLSIGFPLLQLPPGALGARAATGRKVLAPVAFIPVNVTLKRDVASSIELRCHGEGVDLVTPNVALLAWLQQQLKSPRDADLFADAEGENPWGEIATIVRYVAGALEIDLPDFFKQLPCPASGKVASPGADATPSDPPPSLPLVPAPRAGDEQAKPQILLSAVLGLYPLANQGLIEDMEALAGGERVSGPIESFIKLGVALDAPPRNQPRIPIRRSRSSVAISPMSGWSATPIPARRAPSATRVKAAGWWSTGRPAPARARPSPTSSEITWRAGSACCWSATSAPRWMWSTTVCAHWNWANCARSFTIRSAISVTSIKRSARSLMNWSRHRSSPAPTASSSWPIASWRSCMPA
jgi:hypothetical protein